MMELDGHGVPLLPQAHTKASVVFVRQILYGNEQQAVYVPLVDVRDVAIVCTGRLLLVTEQRCACQPIYVTSFYSTASAHKGRGGWLHSLQMMWDCQLISEGLKPAEEWGVKEDTSRSEGASSNVLGCAAFH